MDGLDVLAILAVCGVFALVCIYAAIRIIMTYGFWGD
jgi:hypothetical protein